MCVWEARLFRWRDAPSPPAGSNQVSAGVKRRKVHSGGIAQHSMARRLDLSRSAVASRSGSIHLSSLVACARDAIPRSYIKKRGNDYFYLMRTSDK